MTHMPARSATPDTSSRFGRLALCLIFLVLPAACGQDNTPRLAPGIREYNNTIPPELPAPPAVVDAALSAVQPRPTATAAPATSTPQPAAVVVVVPTPTVSVPDPTPTAVLRTQRRVTQPIATARPTSTVVIPADQRAEPLASTHSVKSESAPTPTAVPTVASMPLSHPTATPRPSATPTLVSTQVAEHPSVARARALAAQHLGLAAHRAHELNLETWDAVVWPSSALGCSREGIAYLTAEVNGYRIVFSHAAVRVSVHTDDKQTPHAIIPENCLSNTAGRPRPHPH